jgi:ABC-2 type transport system permease protein
VYYVVFQVILPGRVPNFAIYLMSGLLIWNAFSGSVSGACGSVVFNANLVKKVRFPLPVLPLSAVGFALVHFVLQLGVLFVVIAALRYSFFGLQLLLVFPAFAVALVFTTALAMLVASLNVRYRDTQHLLDVALLAWFWLNPVVYDVDLIRQQLHSLTWIYFLNPMATVVATFQRAIYKQPYATQDGRRILILADPGYTWYLERLAVVGAASLVLLWVGYRVFTHLQSDFAEDL